MEFQRMYQSVIIEHQQVMSRTLESLEIGSNLVKIADLLVYAFKHKNKLLLCGNGGSAADAQHIATEFVCRFYKERRALDAEALNINTSSLTAIGNDYSFDRVFSRQVEAKGVAGDILIGITTSGTSKNVIAAFDVAKSIGMKSICFTGENAPASLDDICDIVLRVPSTCTPRIQECHIMLGHIICEYVEAVIAEMD